MRRRTWRGAGAAGLGLLMALAPSLAAGAPPVIPPLVPVAAEPPARAGFRDWAISCAGGCRALTRLRSTAPGAPEVLRLSVARTGPEVYAVTLRTPAPLYLPAPLTLAPDGADPVEIPWYTCDPRGCEARLSAGPALIEALRAGQAAQVGLTLVGGEQVRLGLSLRGSALALDALARLDPREAPPETAPDPGAGVSP